MVGREELEPLTPGLKARTVHSRQMPLFLLECDFSGTLGILHSRRLPFPTVPSRGSRLMRVCCQNPSD